MSPGVLVLQLSMYALLYALPHVFFRRHGRRLNLMWWLTAAPFALAPASLLLTFAGRLPASSWLELFSVPVSVAAIGLLFLTLGSHRIPLALWHQRNDAPAAIVTDGAYRHIRHPFYASFLLMLLSSVLAAPQVGTLASLLAGLIALDQTAQREEKRLLASPFGEDYAAYFRRTGRFWPRR